MYIDGVCCEYCRHKDSAECPVSDAAPWSRWKNWCSKYEPDPGIPEAKALEQVMLLPPEKRSQQISLEGGR